jgi:hypothetical protein
MNHIMLAFNRDSRRLAYTNPALSSNVSPFLGTAKALRNRLTAISKKMKLQQRRGRASAIASMSRKRRDSEGECERGVMTAPERSAGTESVESRDTCGGSRSGKPDSSVVVFEGVILSGISMWWPLTMAALRIVDRSKSKVSGRLFFGGSGCWVGGC